jgi:nicotinamide riboside kinase
VSEYAREFWDRHGNITLADMAPIAREQWRREDAAAVISLARPGPSASKLIVCDTDALTTTLWSDLLYGTCPAEVRQGAEERAKHYALYLLLDIDVPFAPDPQRCFPDPADREKGMRLWRGALEQRQLPFELIRGSWLEREQRAIAAITRRLSA